MTEAITKLAMKNASRMSGTVASSALAGTLSEQQLLRATSEPMATFEPQAVTLTAVGSYAYVTPIKK